MGDPHWIDDEKQSTNQSVDSTNQPINPSSESTNQSVDDRTSYDDANNDRSIESIEIFHYLPSAELLSDRPVNQSINPSINQSENSSDAHMHHSNGLNHSSDQSIVPNDYFSYLKLMRELWTDLPELTIEYHDISYTIKQSINHRAISNMATMIVDLFKSINQSINHFLNPSLDRSVSQFQALQPCSGLIKPGRLILLLTPPGHGRSTFLRALSGRLMNDDRMSGEIFYNDQSVNQSAGTPKGRSINQSVPCIPSTGPLQISKLVAYVDQNQCHLPLLTVRETLAFAVNNSVPNPNILVNQSINQSASQSTDQPISQSSEAFRAASAKRVDFLLDLLQLNKAADTLIGDQSMRGVSGGESKRVSIGEVLLSNARVMCLDEVTTGLDSSVAHSVVETLKKWTRVMNGSIVAGLLQPTPEVFNLFDDIILMRHGVVVFDGPINSVSSYLHSIGIPVPDDQDLSDFISDFLGSPAIVYYCILHRASLRVADQSKADIYNKMVTVYSEQSANPISQSIKAPLSREQSASARGCDMSEVCAKKILAMASTTFPPLTTAAMRHAFDNSKYYERIADELNERAGEREVRRQSTGQPVTQMSKYMRASYCSSHSRAWLSHLALCLKRAAIELSRNRSFFLPRMIVAIILGLILGGLFYQSPFSNFQEKLGLITYLTVTLAFRNGVEAPFASNAKYVIAKQCDAGVYPTSAYVLSTLIMNIPVSFTESLVMSCIVYWMTSFTMEVGRFFFFLLVIWLNSIAFSVIYRAAAWGTRTHIEAAQVTTPLVATFYLCSGYLILYKSFPKWLLGLYFVSPFTWSLKSLALNEFLAPRYNIPAPIPGDAGKTLGQAYLGIYDLTTNPAYKWAGVGYLFGFFIVVALLSWFILSRVRYPLSRGTRRIDDEKEAQRILDGLQDGSSVNPIHPNENDTLHAESVRHDIHHNFIIPQVDVTNDLAVRDSPVDSPYRRPRATSVTETRPRSRSVCRAEFAAMYSASFRQPSFASLPFKPINLAWRDLKYTVRVKENGKTYDRALIERQNGYITAGTLTALIGKTGAGKSTLLDVLAGRKTAGKIEGSILVNGHLKEPRAFSRRCGYVEQTDVHTPKLTPRESLMFHAHLRLSRSIDEETRRQFVSDLLDTLELQSVADELVGNEDMPGISPGELKRLTIGLELASNPSVLLIDEPTSTLDSHSALIVMRVIRKIANSGRAVLCTIHQPSQEVFFMFDRLLLLQDGGLTAYFGPVGPSGRDVITYFEQCPGKLVKPPQTNPASWILDVIAPDHHISNNSSNQLIKQTINQSVNPSNKVDFVSIYDRSNLRAENDRCLHFLSKPSSDVSELVFTHHYAASRARQYACLQVRHVINQWRQSRSWFLIFIHAFLGLILGLLYMNAGESTAQQVITKISAEFAGMLFPGWAIMIATLTLLMSDRAVYYRERWSQIYDPLIYALVITVTETCYTVVYVFTFLAFFYPLIGMTHSVTVFFKYFLIQYLVSLFFASIGHLTAALSRDITMGNILAALVGTLVMLFSGLFKLAGEMRMGWKWIYEIDPLSKALIAVTSIEFDCQQECVIFHNQLTPTGEVISDISSYQYAMHYLDAGTGEYWREGGWILLTMIIVRIGFALAWTKVNFVKR